MIDQTRIRDDESARAESAPASTSTTSVSSGRRPLRPRRRKIALTLLPILLLAACVAPGPPLTVTFPGKAPRLPGLLPVPDPLPPGPPGTVISSEVVRPNSIFPGTQARRFLYRSTDSTGSTIAVSGYVVIPAGTPPPGGWPVMTWAHGTVGLADACAPSRSPEYWAYGSGGYEQTPGLIGAGVMVVATDYPGLGTDGPHLYLDGPSAGRSVLDAARAAAAFGGSNRVAIEGFSQGGHAALFAGMLATTYAPDLDVVGTLATAPGSHATFVKTLQPLLGFFGMSGYSPYPGFYAYGLLAADRSLNPGDLLEQSGAAKMSALDDTNCASSPQLTADDFRADFIQLPNWYAALARNEPGGERIAGPVVIAQGSADTSVPALATSLLCGEYHANGTDATVWNYDGQSHTGTMYASLTDRERWVVERLDGSTPSAPQSATSVQAC